MFDGRWPINDSARNISLAVFFNKCTYSSKSVVVCTSSSNITVVYITLYKQKR